MNLGKKVLMSLVFVMALSTISMTPASAAGIRADIVRYDPCPAEIGQYFTVWVKIENIGYGRVDDLSVELVPLYPFSLDAKENAVKNIGILPDNAALFEYHLYVDENAKPGTREIKVRYQDNKDAGWIEKSFEIKVGADTFDSKGTLQLQSIKTEPEVLMPGDRGIVTLTLKNTASQYSISLDGKDYDTNARVQSASLLSSEDITVTSGTYHETGTLGPGDAVDLTYNIEVAEAASDGTKHLEFEVSGSSYSYNYKWDVPVEVDSEDIRIISSKPLTLTGGKGTLEFDVANIHRNTLSSVSIRPHADGVEFLPSEYFIGTMDPDELFTIEFDANTASGNISATKNLTLTAQYRNGYNQHMISGDDLSLIIISEKTKSNTELAGVGAILAILAVSSLVMYWHKKQQK